MASSRVKAAGNAAGWLISILSGAFTLIEVFAPKGLSLSDMGINADIGYLSGLLGLWYVRYGIVALFVSLLLFFVFPREEERVRKRRKKTVHVSKKN